MKNKVFFLVISISLAILGAAVACAPASPTQEPSPASSPTTTPVQPPSASPVPSPEKANWQRLVTGAQKEGTLTYYSNSLVGEIGLAVSRAFNSKYGVKVEIITGPGAEFIERLKTERRTGQMVGDIFDSSPVNMQTLKGEGLAAFVYDDLPVTKERGVWEVEPSLADPQERLFLPLKINYQNPVINTKLVKPSDEPRSFQDFLNPKWKGKMTLVDPITSPGAYSLVVPLLDSGIITEDWIKKLGTQNLSFFKAAADEYGALSRGEHSLSIRGVDTLAAPFAREGAPIKFIGMREGSVVSVTGIAVVKGGPHPNAAKLLLNWILSQEGQDVYAKAMGISSVRRDVTDYRPEAIKVINARLIVTTPEQDLRASNLMRERWLSKLL